MMSVMLSTHSDFLYFYSDCHHCDLHSFPTRRSSDLDFKAYYTTDACSKQLSYSLRGQKYKETAKTITPKIKAACMTYEQGKSRGDRKSTRLNSSHVKISYAVFCLKKKKKQ